MHRSWITARCCPALLVVVAAACASGGSKTNVSSPGDVARDTATASATRSDTMTRRDTTTARDTTARDTTARRDTAAAMPMPAAPTTAAGVQLAVADAPGVGVYVTDATGRAVYVLDAPDSVACSGACATELDPVIGAASIATGTTGLEASSLGTRPLPDGRQQVTYDGKPLYFSRADMAKGDTKGQGSKSYGTVRLLTPKK